MSSGNGEPRGYVHFDTCGHCGQQPDGGEWQPVETVEDEDGESHRYSFCDEECYDAFEPFQG